jgi:hypothetical protein
VSTFLNACEVSACVNGCVHGTCTDSICVCESGFEGVACDEQIRGQTNVEVLSSPSPSASSPETDSACPNACSNHGTCSDGACTCDSGYELSDCSQMIISDGPDALDRLDS